MLSAIPFIFYFDFDSSDLRFYCEQSRICFYLFYWLVLFCCCYFLMPIWLVGGPWEIVGYFFFGGIYCANYSFCFIYLFQLKTQSMSMLMEIHAVFLNNFAVKYG